MKKIFRQWAEKNGKKLQNLALFPGGRGDAPPSRPKLPQIFLASQPTRGWYLDEIIRLAKKFVDKIFFGAPLNLGVTPTPKIFFSPKFLQRCILLANLRFVFKF
jgi:hypothetical protein